MSASDADFSCWQSACREARVERDRALERAAKAEAELVKNGSWLAVLFDESAVFSNLTGREEMFTSLENVKAVLGALRRTMGAHKYGGKITSPMNQDAAIAKELGWTARAVPDEWSSGEPSEVVVWVAPDGTPGNLPKFTSDLNAIHRAIMTRIVHGKSIAQYVSNEHLFEAKLCAISEREQVPVWHFTAELYAEAFLATVDTARPAEIATNATPPETNP